MKIYLFMCLNNIIGDKYYTNEEDVKRLVEKANADCECGDFWYQSLTEGDDE